MTLLARFWGTRGSIPSPGPDTARYGGNTPCVEVRLAGAAAESANGRPVLLSLTHTSSTAGAVALAA